MPRRHGLWVSFLSPFLVPAPPIRCRFRVRKDRLPEMSWVTCFLPVSMFVLVTHSHWPVIARLDERHRLTAQHRTQLPGKLDSRCSAPRGMRVSWDGPRAGLDVTPESRVHPRVCSAVLQSTCFGSGILRGPERPHMASWHC